MRDWLSSLRSKYDSGAAHAFLLYLNVADNILEAENEVLHFLSLSDYLIAKSPLSQAKFVAIFNLGTGIHFASEEMEKQFLAFLEHLKPSAFPKELGGKNIAVAEFLEKRSNSTYAFNLFYEMMGISWSSLDRHLKEVLSDVLSPEEIEKNTGKPFFSVILEYSETLIPPDSAFSGGGYDDRRHLVSLLILAKDPRIREAKNTLICLAESLNSVASQLRSETNCLVPLKIDFPDFDERKKTLTVLRKQYPPLPKDIDATVFARQSAGMTFNIITSLVREYSFRKEPLAPNVLFEKKKKFIDEQSGGLVEIIEPLCGLETIGGLDEHKQYVIEVVKDMRSGEPLAVPMGILLLGAQGTGKSVFAEAIAREAELPFFRFKNLREKWVGSSERNQDFAIELILANAPAVAFIDEFDQQMQMRSPGFADNTGVNQRLEGRWKEIMSDTKNRGKILWLAASNRPDLIDPAYLREGRFDDKIPFFPLSTAGRVDIVKALLRKNEILAKEMRTGFEWDLSEEVIHEFARLAHGHLVDEDRVIKCDPDDHIGGLTDKEGDDEVYFTGGQIENILRVAIRFSKRAGHKKLLYPSLFEALKESIPPKDMISQKQMTELAMFYCNSQRFIPKDGRWYKAAKRFGVIKAKEGTKLKL